MTTARPHTDSHSHPIRPPTLLEAVLLLAVLAFGIALVIMAFGDEAIAGPIQAVLIASGALAGAFAVRRGIAWKDLEQGVAATMASATGAVMILLAIGGLISVWIAAGVIPSLLFYGSQVLAPSMFYPSALVLTAIVSLVIGSSWTTAGTVGVAFMGIADVLGMSAPMTAGAVISGAYFGDKLSPLSDTTNLAPAVAGTDLIAHIKYLTWTTVPALLIALAFFMGATWMAAPMVSAGSVESMGQALDVAFAISPLMLMPVVLMFVLVQLRVPPLPTILLSIAVGMVFALLFQSAVITPGFAEGLAMLWRTAAMGYDAATGDAAMDALLSRGGMVSMLDTIFLIVSAMFFSGMVERSGALHLLLSRLTHKLQSTGALVAGAGVTAMGVNGIAADQYTGIVLTGRLYANEFRVRRIDPRNLSRALEDFGTVTSPLVPWNTCGAYMAATLGVATLDYAPFAVFCLASPMVALAYAVTGFRIAERPVPQPG